MLDSLKLDFANPAVFRINTDIRTNNITTENSNEVQRSLDVISSVQSPDFVSLIPQI